MFDSVGSVRVARRSARRVELALTRSTAWVGMILTALGALIAMIHGLWFLLGGGAIGLLGMAIGSLERRWIFDRDDGILRTDQRMLGISHRSAVPLFHLRAVVVEARPGLGGLRFVAYLTRRNGPPIELDRATTAAPLLKLAQAIADVTELKLVYDATRR